uniref:Uncharacterized protein n=1 Tax=Romanomermis culicivorax TaxID=13658 RepID=A0A915L0D1_ROMCU
MVKAMNNYTYLKPIIMGKHSTLWKNVLEYTKTRNRLHMDTIDMLVRTRLSSQSYREFDYKAALMEYMNGVVYSLACSVGEEKTDEGLIGGVNKFVLQ